MNLNFIKKYSQHIGIDGAIGYSVLSRLISASGGLISLIFIALFLSTEEQGYFYTFGSIIAIQVFFELGLNGIITQYAAHEVAHLRWETATKLTGDPQHLSRLSSLLHFCVKVFTSVAFFLFVILEISGYIFFTKYHHGNEIVSWQLPWMLVAFSTSLMFMVNPVLAFFEGLGKVKEIAQLRFFQQLFNVTAIGLVLVSGGKLWALGIASFISFSILFGGILFSYRKKLLTFIYKAKLEWQIDYIKEIFPYQWKIAVSWVSGYFIFQLFNPVLFATEGPVVAGQMGMTLTALNGISSLSMSWISTKVPTFSQLIALKNYVELDRLFNNTLKQLTAVNLTLLSIFITTVYTFNLLSLPLAIRFLPILPLILLCQVTFTNQFVFSWATYLRCHKEEPFLISSVVIGILCAISIIFLGKQFGLMGIIIGYSFLSIPIGLPWAYLIFKANKKEWH
ncbi:MAG: hypothetical protein K0M50_20305 [Prolixibacteraceae bacterium]|nr:hypothetical protein [Prolixibacteraceae bacterium]